MPNHALQRTRRVVPCGLALAAIAVTPLIAPLLAAEQSPSKVPSWNDVQKVIDAHVSSWRDGKPADLITRSDVAPLLKSLGKIGFHVAEIEEGVNFYLADNHPLVERLRTERGKKFMRAFGHLPDAYDRLARLCAFEEGRRLADEIIGGTNPDLTILWLCTAEAAAEIESRWPQEPFCQNFNVPSGRIYTRADLREHLRTMHLLASEGLRRPGE